MLEIKNNTKNAFVLLITRLDTAEEKISELEDSSVATTKTEKSKENKREKKTKYPRNVRKLLKVKHMYNQNFRRGKEGTEEIFETIMKEKFS